MTSLCWFITNKALFLTRKMAWCMNTCLHLINEDVEYLKQTGSLVEYLALDLTH